MAFILSSELKGALEDPGTLPFVTTDDKKSVSMNQELREHILLDQSEIVAEPRETLAIIKQKPDTGTKPYAKDYEEVFEFEEGLPYADTKEGLSRKVKRLVEKGKLVKVSKWWPAPKLRATLLECDGHRQIPSTKVLKKKRKRAERDNTLEEDEQQITLNH